MKITTKNITYSAIIAALYFALCFVLQPLSFGMIQLRIAEVLTLTPLFGVFGIIGVTVGCLLSNSLIPGAFGLLDIIFGTLTTLVAAILTYLLRKKPYLAAIPPIILNALVLPIIWLYLGADTVYWINFLSILGSQSVVIFLIGLPLYYLIIKRNLFKTKP